nr:MAG TPA: hypothetical protein [Caudoviricetes sp.]
MEKIDVFLFCTEGKYRSNTENFPKEEKVGLLPIFSLGKKMLYILRIYITFRFPDGHWGE